MMLFKRKKKITGIFEDLPIFEGHPSTQRIEQKKRGRRAMQIPTTAANPDVSSDQLLANTGKLREQWQELIFESPVRESKQREISLWLQNNYRVQKWWANSIALSYLQWREAPKSNSAQDSVLRLRFVIPTTVSLTYNIFVATSLYGEGFKRFLKQAQSEKLSLSFTDETRATINFRSIEQECELLIEHEFIGNPVMLKIRTKYWNDLVASVIAQVNR